MVWEPFTGTEPSGVKVAEVAFADVQVKVTCCPAVIVDGEAFNVQVAGRTTGGGALVTVTLAGQCFSPMALIARNVYVVFL